MEKFRALVAGATGMVGEQLLKQLLEDQVYEKVIAVVRKPTGIHHARLEERVVDFENLSVGMVGISAGHGFCCLGTTLKAAGSKERQFRIDHDYVVTFALACRQAGVSRFAVVSSIGASASTSNFYLRTKGEMEEDLRKIPFDSLCIHRPSLLLGNRKELRAGERAATYIMRLVDPLMIGGLRKYRGVEASKVAATMLSAMRMAEPGVKILIP